MRTEPYTLTLLLWLCSALALVGATSLSTASASTSEVETIATGTGSDETQALADALARAVSQVNGVSSSLEVSTGRGVVTAEREGRRGDETEESRVRVEAGTTADARMRSAGRVARYEILETVAEEGAVRVKVRAYVARTVAPRYDAPGSSTGKKRIAVLVGSTRLPTYDFFGRADGRELAGLFAGTLEGNAIDSGLVSALDRATLSASLAELGLIDSGLTGATEKAKLRQFRGADLIVMSQINEADARVLTDVVQTTGQVRRSVIVSFEVDVRAVAPATGEVLLTERYSVTRAQSRDEAILAAADQAASDIIHLLTGKRPPSRRPRDFESQPTEIEPTGPRRSGVVLPNDSR
jgi:hypothetical protein